MEINLQQWIESYTNEFKIDLIVWKYVSSSKYRSKYRQV